MSHVPFKLSGQRIFPAVLCLLLLTPFMPGAINRGQGGPSAAGPATDPFYIQQMEQGRKHFLAGRYDEAAGALEVAAFGLNQEPLLLIRTDLYLAVCRYRLHDPEKCRAALLKAAEIMDTEGIADPGLEPAAVKALKTIASELDVEIRLPVQAEAGPAKPLAPRAPDTGKVIKTKADGWRMKTAARAPENEPAAFSGKEKPDPNPVPGASVKAAGKNAPAGPTSSPKVDDRKAVPVLTELQVLEAKLKADPGDPQTARRLAAIDLRDRRYKEVRKLIQSVLQKTPGDAEARLMLARAEYHLADRTAALAVLRQLADPSSGSRLEKKGELTAAVYTALCLRALGQKESSASLYDEVASAAGPAELDGLLRDEDLINDWAALKSALRK